MTSKPFIFLLPLIFVSCASLPEVKHVHYKLPEKAFYVELPTGEFENRPYDVLGWVRAKANYSTMDVEQHVGDEAMCHNYYNKAAAQLIHEAKKAGADAVIKVRSVVFLLDGKTEEHKTPECSDDGAQGEILLKGVAIKYKKATEPKKVAQ